MSTTGRADCYNRILKEFPQLTPYAHETPYKFYIGRERDELYMSAIVISEYGLVACGEPAQSERFIMRSADDGDYIISNLRPHIDEMLRTLQDFDKIANPQREFDILKNLGFERQNHNGILRVDNTDILIESPYRDFWISGFNGHPTVREHKSTLLEKYFSTLDELLDYIVDGGIDD